MRRRGHGWRAALAGVLALLAGLPGPAGHAQGLEPAGGAGGLTPPLALEYEEPDFRAHRISPDGLVIGTGARGRRTEALQARTRERAWVGELRSGAVGPLEVGESSVFEAASGSLVALELATGRERWKASPPDPRFRFETRPLARDGRVYVGGRTSDEAADAFYTTLLAFDAKSGALQWEGPRWAAEDGPLQPELVGTGGRLYARRGLDVVALDGRSGAVAWTARAGLAGGPALAAVDGAVVAVSRPVGDQGLEVVSFEPASGLLLWRQVLPAEGKLPLHAPAIGGGRVYVALPGRLHALDLNAGRLLWSVLLEQIAPLGRLAPNLREFAAPVVSGRQVYVTDGEYLAALDGASGRTTWRSDPGLSGPLLVHGDLLLAGEAGWPGASPSLRVLRTAGPLEIGEPPTTADGWVRLALRLRERGRELEAREAVREAYALDPAAVLDDEVLVRYFGQIEVAGPLLPASAGPLRRVEIDYSWVGFAAQSWVQLSYVVEREGEAARLRSAGYRRVRGAPEPLRTLERPMPAEPLERLAAGLRNFVPTKRTFAVITHRDDYPRVEARLEFAGGQRVRLSSSSNTVGMIPWHAEVDSKISVQFSPQTAVDLLHLLHVAAPETWNELPPEEVGASPVDRRWNRPLVQ